MRRDVRMGFGVGGVLLAVIIVAFLVIHRNHNKAVAFDKGTADGTADSVDVNASGADVGRPPAGAPSPSASLDATAAKIAPDKAAADPKPAQPADGDKADGDRWDALFASTSPNPAQNQLSRGNGSTQTASAKSSSRKNDATAVKPMKMEEAPADATAAPPPNQPLASSESSSAGVSVAGAASQSVRTHTIQPNETLSGISKLVYGESRHYKAIEAANPGIEPTRLKPGTILKIPPIEKAKATEKAAIADAASAADGKTYVVQKDDNLYKITRKLYGNGEKQEELYTMNKKVIGPDSTKLKPGMVLKLPAAPAAQ